MTRALVALFGFFLVAVCMAQHPAPAALNSPTPVAGAWSGHWQSLRDPSAGGSMDIELEVNGEQITGCAKARIRGNCSNQWQKLSGVVKEGKVFGSYNLGGDCGKVDLVLRLESDGNSMTGTWNSEFPSNGTYSLRRVSAARR